MNNIDFIKDNIFNLNSILDRKKELLTQILNISENQKMFIQSLQDENSLNLYLSESLKQKQSLIDEIKFLDDSFLQIFESFNGSLNENKNFFKQDILSLKQKISDITNLDFKIKFTEQNNKPFFQNINFNLKKNIHSTSNKNYILNKYSQNSNIKKK